MITSVNRTSMVPGVILCERRGLSSVGCIEHTIPFPGQVIAHGLAQSAFILNQQNRHRGFGSLNHAISDCLIRCIDCKSDQSNLRTCFERN